MYEELQSMLILLSPKKSAAILSSVSRTNMEQSPALIPLIGAKPIGDRELSQIRIGKLSDHHITSANWPT